MNKYKYSIKGLYTTTFKGILYADSLFDAMLHLNRSYPDIWNKATTQCSISQYE